MGAELPSKWREALALTGRRAPEYYEQADFVEASPHSDAIRFALDEVGISAVFCIERVPTIALLSVDAGDRDRIDEVHRALWNQGLMSLLLVTHDDELIAYSLVRRPIKGDPIAEDSDPRLVETLSLVRDALELRELIRSTESGRYWAEKDAFFEPTERVDNVLLANLLAAYRELGHRLGSEAAQALLMQTMFVAYLEDRRIIGADVFLEASQGKCRTFADVLARPDTSAFERLFAWLKGAFNGDIFNAPCAFDVGSKKPPRVERAHLEVLARFRHGREEMVTRQLRFFGYDFRYIPVALISVVYDRFLKEEAEQRSLDGAFYTPMFLADVVVEQVWAALTEQQKRDGTFTDPACGSGVFLVRVFQRLVSERRIALNQRHLGWKELTRLVRRLHGGDINASAVRIALFSLYIALLENSDPRDLPALIKRGKLLPHLYGSTLLPNKDFFLASDDPLVDVVIGNPPWKGRTGQITSAQTWSRNEGFPDPAKDIAWGFIWKSLKSVRKGGVVGLLLPAMGLLHNASQQAQDARKRFFRQARILRIINFSDLCFQLFDDAARPTAFALFSPSTGDAKPYRFEYWTPKADLNLRLKRILTLSKADRIGLRSDEIEADPGILKRRLWTRAPEESLLQYLKTFPRLNELVVEARSASATEDGRPLTWAIGQGFQPALRDRVERGAYKPKPFPELQRLPFVDTEDFVGIALPRAPAPVQNPNWLPSEARRRGFVAGYFAPHIVIPQGVERAVGRVRAAYSDHDFIFQHSLQAIAVPAGKENEAKLLTAVLNSRLAAWFYFHETANLGTDRAKVHQTELLTLPFALPSKMPNATLAQAAAQEIVRAVDDVLKHGSTLSRESEVFQKIDTLVCRYFDIDEIERAIVDETFNFVFPAIQPRRSAGTQMLWAAPSYDARAAYATTLCLALKDWLKQPVQASLFGRSSDIAIIKLQIASGAPHKYHEVKNDNVELILSDISKNLRVDLPGNIHLVPDIRIIIGSELYLIKPLELRHWLTAAALADAEQIAAEFQQAIGVSRGERFVSAGR